MHNLAVRKIKNFHIGFLFGEEIIFLSDISVSFNIFDQDLDEATTSVLKKGPCYMLSLLTCIY